jgi:hypothetical protein
MVLASNGRPGNEGGTMSEMNGDKARFGRERKQGIRRRNGIRELRTTLAGMTSGTEVAASGQRANRTASGTAVATDRRPPV